MRKLFLLYCGVLLCAMAPVAEPANDGIAPWIYHPGYVSNTWYGPNVSCSAVTIPTAERIYATPLPVYKKITVDKLGSYLSTSGTGSQARFGIYDSTATNGRPGRLLATTATFTTQAATGSLSADLTAEVNLNPGVYWLAQTHYWATAAPQLCGFNASTALQPTLIGGSAITGAISGLVSQTPFFVYVAGTYANGLPSTFGTPTTIVGNVAGEMVIHVK